MSRKDRQENEERHCHLTSYVGTTSLQGRSISLASSQDSLGHPDTRWVWSEVYIQQAEPGAYFIPSHLTPSSHFTPAGYRVLMGTMLDPILPQPWQNPASVTMCQGTRGH